jgi:hypothetical protein
MTDCQFSHRQKRQATYESISLAFHSLDSLACDLGSFPDGLQVDVTGNTKGTESGKDHPHSVVWSSLRSRLARWDGSV